ncbi:hypothetical protein NGM37_37110, partial [Streptomyces sp. TRM76130]|nr:hypothetical protein [Streptomyces sp. TRM76130]
RPGSAGRDGSDGRQARGGFRGRFPRSNRRGLCRVHALAEDRRHEGGGAGDQGVARLREQNRA